MCRPNQVGIVRTLPIFPNPTRLRVLSTDDGGVLRKLYCKLYDNCLNVAYINSWPGFGCNECRAYIQISTFEIRRDASAIADLLIAMRAQGPLLNSVAEYEKESFGKP